MSPGFPVFWEPNPGRRDCLQSRETTLGLPGPLDLNLNLSFVWCSPIKQVVWGLHEITSAQNTVGIQQGLPYWLGSPWFLLKKRLQIKHDYICVKLRDFHWGRPHLNWRSFYNFSFYVVFPIMSSAQKDLLWLCYMFIFSQGCTSSLYHFLGPRYSLCTHSPICLVHGSILSTKKPTGTWRAATNACWLTK